MNKKELAKLLFQHKDIKSLFESRQFDASTLKKVISEEIMREAEDNGWKSNNSEETKAMIAQIKDLTATLEEFKTRLSDVKQEKRTAKANKDKDAASDAQDEKIQIVSDIDRLEVHCSSGCYGSNMARGVADAEVCVIWLRVFRRSEPFIRYQSNDC